jgi:SulP family sulfate permease
MTLSVIDDMTATKGNRNQECIGQGVGNFVSGV